MFLASTKKKSTFEGYHGITSVTREHMLHFCSTFHCKIYKGNQKNIQKPYFVKVPGIWGPGVFGCLGKLPNMKGRDCYLVPRLPNHVS